MKWELSLISFPFLFVLGPVLISYSALEKQILKFPKRVNSVSLLRAMMHFVLSYFVNFKGVFESYIMAFFTPLILIKVNISQFIAKRIMRNGQQLTTNF